MQTLRTSVSRLGYDGSVKIAQWVGLRVQFDGLD